MVSLTFFNLDNADTCRINLRDEQRMLIDYADRLCRTDRFDKRSDLPKLLKDDLALAKTDTYKVVAFTHLDDDHTQGAGEFFWFDHDKARQGKDRKKIGTLWVPACVLYETKLKDDGKIIQEEARHRLIEGYGIVVFSRPERVREWLASQGLTVASRKDFFVDAGKLVPGFTLGADGVEFFAHSPHATRTNENKIIDRNGDSLVFQARFQEGGVNTDVLFAADINHEVLAEIVDITKYHKNEDRLHWNVYKLPHHCSYTAIGPEKGEDKTEPNPQVKWLCETQGEKLGYIVSPSKPLPLKNSDEDRDVQPPHREAANYYKQDVIRPERLLVTMAEPNEANPKPVVIEIGRDGATKKTIAAATVASVVSPTAPRAG